MFEVAMLHSNMFDQLEDTEMAVDAGKLLPAGEDIDIDLDFSDHGQDEMMTEEVLDPTYEMVMGDDMVPEQDEAMTDEGLEEPIFDEEITDAPVEAVPTTDFDLFPNIELENKTELPPNDQANILNEEKNTIAGSIEVVAEAGEAHPVLLSPSAVKDDEEHNLVATNQDENKIGTSAPEEVEELITWESDEEDENTAEVGDTFEPIALATTVPNEKETGKESEHVTNEISHNSSYTAESNRDAQATTENVLAEPAGNHEENNKFVEQLSNEDVHEDATDAAKHALAADAGTVPTADPEGDEVQESDPQAAMLEEQALQQLHPMVIRYMDEEMSLFPPTEEGEHTMFFLSEKKLAFKSCENLFKAFREVLGESINKDETLVLVCPDLGLDIHERIPETSTLSVAQLLHLYLGLSHHDGHEQAPPMPFILKHHYDISARLNHLYALLDSGKGLSAIPGYSTVEHVDVGEHGEGNQEYENEQDGDTDNSNQPSDEVPEVKLLANESDGNQDGVATPIPQSDPEEEYDLDFRSPAVAQRSQVLSGVDATTEAATELNITTAGLEEEAVIAEVDETASAQNTIEHDDDGEDETLEGSRTYAEHNGNPSSNLLGLDIDQQNTNSATDDVISTTKDTNYSDVNDGLDKVTGDDPFAEDPLDLEHPLKEPDIVESHPESGEATEESTNKNAGSSVNQNTSNNNQTVDVADDFDEIGYSSSEDEMENTSSVKSTKHNPDVPQIAKPLSPKRSIDDLDESTRDTKKLRSI